MTVVVAAAAAVVVVPIKLKPLANDGGAPRNDNAARRKRVYVQSCIIVISASTQRSAGALECYHQSACYIVHWPLSPFSP